MPVIKQKYSKLEDMYDNYSTVGKEMEFEGRVYQFKGTIRNYDRSIHLYHCDSEQHYISVHLQFNVPFLIETFYSVNEVTVYALHRAG